VLIVPSWILKYDTLDLSPHNSLVRYLVECGHAVFTISWKKPREEARDAGLNDYLQLGLFDALVQVRRIAGAAPIRATGNCLGGTLLAIGAAALGRHSQRHPVSLATMTLFAAQTDFSEPAEPGLFIGSARLLIWMRWWQSKAIWKALRWRAPSSCSIRAI